jgi:O-antigen/teichoic acid export membrane protein
MNREFLINIIFLVVINLMIKPFYIFGIDRTIQNEVADGDYGMYFTLFGFTYMFQIINDFGIQNFNNRNIAQSRQLIDKYFPNILALKMLMALVFMAVVWTVARILKFDPFWNTLLLLVAINWILTSFLLYLRSNISGLGMYRTDSVLSVLDKLLLIIICGFLLWSPWGGGTFQIEWFALAQTFSLGVTGIVAFVIVFRKLNLVKWRFRPVFWLLIFKQSYPFALVIFLMTAYTRLDAVMIERILPNGRFEADIYASAFRLLDAANMFGYMFASLLLPMFARLLKQQKSVSELTQTGFNLIWSGALTLAVSVWFFKEEIMILLYDTVTPESGPVLGYLIISFIAMSGGYIFGTLLTANGNLKGMNIIFVFGLILNFILNWMLIPRYMAVGAAIATCFTQFFVFILQWWLAIKKLDVVFPVREWSSILAFSIAFVILGYVFKTYLPVGWIVKFLLCALSGAILAFSFRVLKIRNFSELLKKT